MRAFNFTLLAVFSCIAMIGATPIGDSAPAGGIGRRQDIEYVPLRRAVTAHRCSDPIEQSSLYLQLLHGLPDHMPDLRR